MNIFIDDVLIHLGQLNKNMSVIIIPSPIHTRVHSLDGLDGSTGSTGSTGRPARRGHRLDWLDGSRPGRPGRLARQARRVDRLDGWTSGRAENSTTARRRLDRWWTAGGVEGWERLSRLMDKKIDKEGGGWDRLGSAGIGSPRNLTSVLPIYNIYIIYIII